MNILKRAGLSPQERERLSTLPVEDKRIYLTSLRDRKALGRWQARKHFSGELKKVLPKSVLFVAVGALSIMNSGMCTAERGEIIPVVQPAKTPDLDWTLEDVDILTATGSCAEELKLEARLAKTKSKLNQDNTLLKEILNYRAHQFSQAAKLAQDNEVPCLPDFSGDTVLEFVEDGQKVEITPAHLTPNMDLGQLVRGGLCAARLEAQIREPGPDLMSGQRTEIEVGNATLKLQAQLAKAHQVPCAPVPQLSVRLP